MDFLHLLLGISIGIIISIVFVFFKNRSDRKNKSSEIDGFRNSIASLEREKAVLQSLLQEKIKQFAELDEKSEQQHRSEIEKASLISKLETELLSASERLSNHKKELEQWHEQMRLEFENTANRLLKNHSTEFSERSQQGLSEILKPFHEKLGSFENKMGENYEKTLRDTTELKANLTSELQKLHELSNQVSLDANNLAKALKGEGKTQGSWGELILSSILEKSGLVKDREYFEQFSTTAEDSIIRPDVVINLPDNKHLIIDSKVSLTAYENYIESTIPEDREKFLKLHLQSVKSHISGLSNKHYEKGVGLNTPDFVLLFMPLESTFSFTLENARDLFAEAWAKKIIIVSPTTLLASLMTVSSIWKQENQSRNAMEIARQSAELLDDIARFYEHIEKADKKLRESQDSMDEALRKLTSGRGNIVARATKIKELGVKNKKDLPATSENDLFLQNHSNQNANEDTQE
jgi:DNA recombination protein RmuC